MSKLGEGILTSTGGEKIFFGGHTIPKPNFWFWHHIAAKFRHTLKNFEVGLSKKNFKKKIILFKKGVEVWGFDGSSCTPSLKCRYYCTTRSAFLALLLPPLSHTIFCLFKNFPNIFLLFSFPIYISPFFSVLFKSPTPLSNGIGIYYQCWKRPISNFSS
jgi:hypothetical protein